MIKMSAEMSPVMHLLHVLHTRDATCSALNTVSVKTELSAVVESHRDRLRLLWLVLRSEHYCVRTHTHAVFYLHTQKWFSVAAEEMCAVILPHTYLHWCTETYSIFAKYHTSAFISLTLSVCPFSIVQHSRTAHTHTQSGVCAIQFLQVVWD